MIMIGNGGPIPGYEYDQCFTAEVAIVMNPEEEALRCFVFGGEVTLKDNPTGELVVVLGFVEDSKSPVVLGWVDPNHDDGLQIVKVKKAKFAQLVPVFHKTLEGEFAPSRIDLKRSDAKNTIELHFDPQKKKAAKATAALALAGQAVDLEIQDNSVAEVRKSTRLQANGKPIDTINESEAKDRERDRQRDIERDRERKIEAENEKKTKAAATKKQVDEWKRKETELRRKEEDLMKQEEKLKKQEEELKRMASTASAKAAITEATHHGTSENDIDDSEIRAQQLARAMAAQILKDLGVSLPPQSALALPAFTQGLRPNEASSPPQQYALPPDQYGPPPQNDPFYSHLNHDPRFSAPPHGPPPYLQYPQPPPYSQYPPSHYPPPSASGNSGLFGNSQFINNTHNHYHFVDRNSMNAAHQASLQSNRCPKCRVWYPVGFNGTCSCKK